MRDIRSLSGSSAHIQRLMTADTRRLGTALREVRGRWLCTADEVACEPHEPHLAARS